MTVTVEPGAALVVGTFVVVVGVAVGADDVLGGVEVVGVLVVLLVLDTLA